MKKRVVAMTMIVLAAPAARAVMAQDLTPPTVSVYRVLQVLGDTTSTVAEGMFRVDPALLGTAACDYTAEVEIKDAHGEKLRDDKWDSACPVQNGAVVPALELFRFGMPNGRLTYTVTITVNPKDRPKEKHVATVKVASLDQALTSDLILARQIGVIDTTIPKTAQPWTIQRGGLGIRTASEVAVEPGAEQLGYYVELYPRVGKPLSGVVTGIVRRPDGLELARFPLQKLDTVSSFDAVAGKANLAGLAPGKYTFDVQLALTDTTITLTHPFEMMAAAVAPASTAGSAAPGFFTTVSDEDMEHMYGAAAVWLTQRAESEVYKNLSPNGKREYLNRQFGPDMPTPDDGKESSSIDAFVTRAQTVAKRYSEKAGRGVQDGWRTDRGRIYMLRGEPVNIIHQPAPRSGQPYEIFFYQVGKGLAYLFADDTRMGQYRLVWTNDPNEQGVVNGLQRVGPEAQEDLQKLGIRVTVNQ